MECLISTVVFRLFIGSAQEPLGFIENSDDLNDLQAWCHACEKLFQNEGRTTDKFRVFHDMAIV